LIAILEAIEHGAQQVDSRTVISGASSRSWRSMTMSIAESSPSIADASESSVSSLLAAMACTAEGCTACRAAAAPAGCTATDWAALRVRTSGITNGSASIRSAATCGDATGCSSGAGSVAGCTAIG
jgi:hypothetical protein